MSLLVRGASAVAATLLLVGTVGSAAAGHVTVDPSQAEQGGFSTLAFRVPNERDDQSTTKLQVLLPADQPVASVSVQPHPGWSYSVRQRHLDEPIDAFGSPVSEVVAAVTFTADSAGTAIRPGEFDEFHLSLGPLPEAEKMVFRAIQTYSGGEVVRWVDVAVGDAEPEHPAPVLSLVPPAASTGDESDSTTTGAASRAGDSGDESSSDSAARALSVVALLVAVGALGLALRRRRS